MKKYIVVDVDGVLNSFEPTKTSFPTTGTVNGATYNLNLDKNHAKWLLKLAEITNSELLWGTTWGNHANEQIGKQIGLPELPVPEMLPPKFSETSASWKSRCVLSYVKDIPFVWFDDDYVIADYLSGHTGVLITVDPCEGLTEGQIVRAERILKDWDERITV